ncbi:hypothetical protein AKO1_012111 [Acrasis kona]|uniref:Uncharacterized protein n=1 Tax=Acrasis kona TaxID=1008807 RepID=A0AAW2ZD50_9EUKA
MLLYGVALAIDYACLQLFYYLVALMNTSNIDLDYEFNAPKYFDFELESNKQTDESFVNNEEWFRTHHINHEHPNSKYYKQQSESNNIINKKNMESVTNSQPIKNETTVLPNNSNNCNNHLTSPLQFSKLLKSSDVRKKSTSKAKIKLTL